VSLPFLNPRPRGLAVPRPARNVQQGIPEPRYTCMVLLWCRNEEASAMIRSKEKEKEKKNKNCKIQHALPHFPQVFFSF